MQIWLWILVALLGGTHVGCTHTPPTPQALWVRSAEAPSRLLLVVLPHLSNEEIGRLSSLSFLAARGITLPRATVGHLPADETTSLSVLDRGLPPKALDRVALTSLSTRLNTETVRQDLAVRLRDGSPWKAIFANFLQHTPPQIEQELRDTWTELERQDLARATIILVVGLRGKPRVPPQRAPASGNFKMVRKLASDGDLKYWLRTNDRVRVASFAADLRAVPEIVEIYTKQPTGNAVHYIRTYRTASMSETESAWADDRNAALVESFADGAAPEIVALVAESHGGESFEAIQRTPWILWTPQLSEGGTKSEANVTLVDVNPMISQLMGLEVPAGLEGSPPPLPLSRR